MKMNPDVASLTLISKDDPFSEWGSLQVNPEGNRQRQGLPCSGYKGRYAGKVKKGKLGRIITASTSSYKALPKLRMAVMVVGYAHSSDDVRRH